MWICAAASSDNRWSVKLWAKRQRGLGGGWNGWVGVGWEQHCPGGQYPPIDPPPLHISVQTAQWPGTAQSITGNLKQAIN